MSGLNNSMVETRPHHTATVNRLADLIGDAAEAPIASILIGLQLRGFLTAGEKELLGRLQFAAPIGFLYRSGQFYFTRCGCNLDTEPLQMALQSSSPAIFAYRCTNKEADCDCSCGVQTAAIDPTDPEPMLLGMVRRSFDRLDFSEYAQFGELLHRFREIYDQTAPLLERLKTLLVSDAAVMIINRATGRITTVNPRFEELSRLPLSKLADKEYGAVRPRIKAALSDYTITLTNHSQGPLHMTTVVLNKRTDRTRTTSGTFVHDFLSHRIRNKISAIATSASHLESTADQHQADTVELAQVIQSAAVDIDRHLALMNFILDYGRLPKEPVNVRDEINETLDYFETLEDVRIAAAGTSPDVTVTCPSRTISLLLEAIFRAHVEGLKQDEMTTLTITSADDNRWLSLTVSSPAADTRTRLERNWRQLAVRLAQLTGLALTTETETANHKLTTTLTIPSE